MVEKLFVSLNYQKNKKIIMLLNFSVSNSNDNEDIILEQLNFAIDFWVEATGQGIPPNSTTTPKIQKASISLFQAHNITGGKVALFQVVNNKYAIEALWSEFYHDCINAFIEEEEFNEKWGDSFFCDYENFCYLNEDDFPDFCKWRYPEMQIERVFVENLNP